MTSYTEQFKAYPVVDLLTQPETELEVANLLDGEAYVRVVDLCPRLVPIGYTADFAVIRAARTCTSTERENIFNLVDAESDAKLIRYLFTQYHTSPFEFPNITFEVLVPNFVCKQILRHRTGKFNESSQRYGEQPDKFFSPTHHGGEGLRRQAKTNRQSSLEVDMEHVSHSEMLQIMTQWDDHIKAGHALYHRSIEAGLAKECARSNLPFGQYTKLMVQFDLSNLIKFFRLRCAPDAQFETRAIADAMRTLATQFFAVSMNLLIEEKQRVVLSKPEIAAMKSGEIPESLKARLDKL